MPIIQVQLNMLPSEDISKDLQFSLTRLISSIMNKPQKDIMVVINFSSMLMGGDFTAAASIDFRCISGLDRFITEKLCSDISQILNDYGIVPSRVFMNFSEVVPECAWKFVESKSGQVESGI